MSLRHSQQVWADQVDQVAFTVYFVYVLLLASQALQRGIENQGVSWPAK